MPPSESGRGASLHARQSLMVFQVALCSTDGKKPGKVLRAAGVESHQHICQHPFGASRSSPRQSDLHPRTRMLQRLGHAGRLVITLQRRQLADRSAVHLASSDASRSSLIASLLGRAEHTDTTAAAKAATAEAASAGATDASAKPTSGKHSIITAAADAATADEEASEDAASSGATDAPAHSTSGEHTDTTPAAEAASKEAASAGAKTTRAQQTSGKRTYTTAAAAAATSEAASTAAFDAPAEPASGDAEHRAAVNRLMYRSKQRGFLELDLLVIPTRLVQEESWLPGTFFLP